MKNLKLILPMMTLVFACNSVPENESAELHKQAEHACADTAWLEGMIQSFENRGDQKAEVIRYRYNNEVVYYVDDCKGCADSMQIVYSCAGEQRCTFGGIAGFNTCPDFFETATDKKIVWHN